MFADGHLLLTLHEPPKPDEEERAGRFFWRQPDGTWSSSERGKGPNALARHLNEYTDILDELEKRDQAAGSAEEYFGVLSELGPLQRAAHNMHQALQQAREMVSTNRDIINFRDEAYQIARTAELLYQDSKNSLEFAVAKRAEEQSHHAHQMSLSAHRLNMLAAFFFPIVTLTAIFGTNLKHGLEEYSAPLPFVLLLLTGLLSGLILKSTFARNTEHHPGGQREKNK
jgi:hypothetical protein